MIASDVLTDQAMVILQDRPVVPIRAWLTDALRVCGETGRVLQLVTPITSRLSMPLRLVLTGPGSRWVVRHGDSCYDGLTGVPLTWDGTMFVQSPDARDYAPGFVTRPADPVGAQLTVTYRLRHPAGAVFGGAVELLARELSGRPLAGWGPAEPVANRWDRAQLTSYCQTRDTVTWLAVVSTPYIGGTIMITPVPGGHEESVTLVAGYADTAQVPVAGLPQLLAAVSAEHRPASMFAQLNPGRPDLTTEPRWMGAPAPLGMAVLGAKTAPGFAAQPIGPATWFPLGDGRSADGWPRYEELLRQLS